MGSIEPSLICIRASGVCGWIWISASLRMIAHVVTCIIGPYSMLSSAIWGFGAFFLSFLMATVLLNFVCIFRE